MHPLLTRQLRRYFPDGTPVELSTFLQAIDTAYSEADIDRGLLERSLDLTSRELLARGAALEAEILERKQATADLERRAAAIAASTDGISVLDADGVFVWVNAAHRQLYGYAPEELVGQSWKVLHRPDEVKGFQREVTEALTTCGRWSGQVVGRMANGDLWEQEVSLTLHVDSVIRIARDVSERTRLERSLREAQKMDAIGRLAGGIAHDFNNVLAVIVACADLVLADLPADSPAQADILEIRSASERAAAVTARLLTFARRQVVEPRLMILDDVVLQLSKLLRRTIGEQVALAVRPGVPGAQVLADAGQIEQVLLNLVLNARDAMPQGGTITLITEEMDDSGFEASSLPDGDYLLLRVVDNGVGIAEAARAHLFEPFFTTKPEGYGTGLGLATCYGIMRQLGGMIWADSELGRGTTFFVAVPRAHGDPAHACPSTKSSAPRGGTERVLLVEDDPHVRQVAARLLLLWGYHVTVCSCAEEALRVVSEIPPPDLVVTDVVMPRLSGPGLVERLRADGLRAPVLFVTGYMDELQADREMRVLAKPFTAKQLAIAVRETLDRSPSGQGSQLGGVDATHGPDDNGGELPQAFVTISRCHRADRG